MTKAKGVELMLHVYNFLRC